MDRLTSPVELSSQRIANASRRAAITSFIRHILESIVQLDAYPVIKTYFCSEAISSKLFNGNEMGKK
jgi:hypothetical protein